VQYLAGRYFDQELCIGLRLRRSERRDDQGGSGRDVK
jgi:hypothetical protein